ncbi:ubiquitin carboxyl-terminal hydrolase 37-like isoform X1 [Astyanax mexicanus]|uniref:Ubiquitin carboxyl-terminal hydrolase 37-like isoform X1 n=1 Tax=Astyanax mexicanus TaxID=7994 RepID=A0A8T2LAY0_ASTMX|nr:ubiquitin carboxyl-terminal hydrolase 37-like isoform X1 [Astyanax mexicanus]
MLWFQRKFGYLLNCLLRCGNQKARVEDFNHLALALAHQGSVRDCLKLFFSVDVPHAAQGQSVSRYSLVSVLNHIGSSIHYGHYLRDCSSRADSCWLCFNDDSVSMMTEKQVLERRRSSAYVLFYERDS